MHMWSLLKQIHMWSPTNLYAPDKGPIHEDTNGNKTICSALITLS